MTFLPDPSVATDTKRVQEQYPAYMRNPVELIVSVTNLADSDAHYKHIDMDGYDCISVQVECGDGSSDDDVTFTWEETLDPEDDPTTAGIQWTGNDIWSGSSTVVNSSAAIDRIDTVTIRSPVWYRLTYQRTDGSADTQDFEVKIKRWKS